MKTRRFSEENETYLTVADRCNQKCVFCFAEGKTVRQTPAQLEANIKREKKTLNVGGWEPTLAKDLVYWVAKARAAGPKNKAIILRTNALAFAENTQLIRDLVDAGVTMFSVNFPAHVEKVCDFITQTRGNHAKRVKAIRNLADIAGGDKVRLTVVINSLNRPILPDYARFVAEEFPSIKGIGLNMVCMAGRAKERWYLVPRLTAVGAALREMTGVCAEHGLNMLVDDVPLCFMRGFEQASVDVWAMPKGDDSHLTYKDYHQPCVKCTLKSICSGLTRDYFGVYGAGELRASRKSASVVLERMRKHGCFVGEISNRKKAPCARISVEALPIRLTH